MEARWGRAWFALTALAVLVGLVIQVPVAAVNDQGFFTSSPERALNVFCFFTVQSNIIVGVTSAVLAVRTPTGTFFRTARLTGLVAISITGIVYHVALAQLFDLSSWALAADVVLHTIVPIAAVAGWLLFGPRGLTSARVVLLSVAFPVAWLIFTLVRGAFVHFYPYPFIDVDTHGYGRVAGNCVWVALLYLGVAAGFHLVDQRLRRKPGAAPNGMSPAGDADVRPTSRRSSERGVPLP